VDKNNIQTRTHTTAEAARIPHIFRKVCDAHVFKVRT